MGNAVKIECPKCKSDNKRLDRIGRNVFEYRCLDCESKYFARFENICVECGLIEVEWKK